MGLLVFWCFHLIRRLADHVPAAIHLTLVFTVVLLLTRLFLTQRRLTLPLPPGPYGVPILGFLPFMGRDYHLTLTNLSRRYGSVFQLFLGSKRLIILSDPKLVRQAFRQTVFSGRPDTELTKLLQGYGIINSDGALWREQRAFLHSIFREFGAKNTGPGKAVLEENIRTEVANFLENLDNQEGAPCHMRPALTHAVSNVVGSMLMSVTFSDTDKKFRRLLDLIDEGFRLLTLAVPVNFIPILRFLPGFNYAYQKIKMNKNETASYFLKVAEDHKRSLDPSNVRDFVDAYLMQLKKVEDGKKMESYFSEQQLVQIMGDIFSAGLETVTSLLDWAVLFLVRNPSVQKRIQAELDDVVGQSRMPTLADLPNLPYTEATILEVLRRANVIAIGIAHATLEDTKLGGYWIPKDSHIIPNLWAIHMDSELWVEPEKFNPERFIVDGKIFKPHHFMPFSVGRRMCLGDTLTKMEVFLFLTSMLHRFSLEVPEGEDVPKPDAIIGVAMNPRPFRVCAISRDRKYLLG